MKSQKDKTAPPDPIANPLGRGDISETQSIISSPKENSRIQNIEDILFNNNLLSQLSQNGNSPQNRHNISTALSDFMMTQIDEAFGAGMDSPSFSRNPEQGKQGYSGVTEAIRLKLFKAKDTDKKPAKGFIKVVSALQSDKLIKTTPGRAGPDNAYLSDRAIQEVSEKTEEGSQQAGVNSPTRQSRPSSKGVPSEVISPINIKRLPGLVNQAIGTQKNDKTGFYARFFNKKSHAHKHIDH